MFGCLFLLGIVSAFSGKKEEPPVAAGDSKPDKPAAEPEKPEPSADGTELPMDRQEKVRKATVHLIVSVNGRPRSSGTGFFAIERGYILTNAHVLGMLEEDAPTPSSIEVVLNSGEKDEKKISGQILGVDRDNDLAVLKAVGWIGSGSLPEPLKVKPAAGLRTLQKVWVFGFPFGDELGPEMRISSATVAALRKKKGTDLLSRVDVDGNMQPGNSGGPVVDARGDVVGVAVSIILGTGINFAVPGEYVRAAGRQLFGPRPSASHLSSTASSLCR